MASTVVDPCEEVQVNNDTASDDDEDYEYEEYEDEEDEDEDDDDGGQTLFFWRTPRRADHKEILRNFQKIDEVPLHPIDHDIAQDVARHTAGDNVRFPLGPLSKRHKTSPVVSCVELLRRRETNVTGMGHMSRAQQCHLASHHLLPSQPVQVVDKTNSRAYIGQFNEQGNLFIAAYQQQRRVRIYQPEHNWRVMKDVFAANIRWTVTDTTMSPDQRHLIYATIASTVNLVDLHSSEGQCSVANVTDVHTELDLSDGARSTTYSRWSDNFGIWSVQWSANGRELIAGTNDNSMRVYDMEKEKTVVRVTGHTDDVNAVAFAQRDDPNVIITGGDDSLCKVWDRRNLGTGGRHCRAAGVLVGHMEGITHIDSKDDGRYFISNSKDQTIKLWDMRSMLSEKQYIAVKPSIRKLFGRWDYRWSTYPGQGYVITSDHDCSIKSYRGHCVEQTLIRSYFSPAFSTGQKYIYTGSADNMVWIYDVVTGRAVRELRYHAGVVRDCHWHPHFPLLVSTAFDGTVCCWEPQSQLDTDHSALPHPGCDKYNDLY